MQSGTPFYILAEIGSTAAWWGIGGTILGALVSGFFTHQLTKDRDAATRQSILDREADIRRRQFRRHILKCSYTLERIEPTRAEDVWKAYTGMAPDIMAEAELVAGDYPAEFIALVKCAGEWRRDEAEAARKQDRMLRDVLRDSMRKVYELTRQTSA